MPTVMDIPAHSADVATHDRHSEWPRTPPAHPGFWRTLAQGITTYLAPTPREWQGPSCRVRCSFETPMDRLAREHPSLSLFALAII